MYFHQGTYTLKHCYPWLKYKGLHASHDFLDEAMTHLFTSRFDEAFYILYGFLRNPLGELIEIPLKLNWTFLRWRMSRFVACPAQSSTRMKGHPSQMRERPTAASNMPRVDCEDELMRQHARGLNASKHLILEGKTGTISTCFVTVTHSAYI